jgi:2-dehydro-3-deoxyphosphogluconate aldolase/(4S)-4-hydroxy-2-oxoglutarate aldolase
MQIKHTKAGLSPNLESRIAEARVIAVVTVANPDLAVRLAEVLLESGIKAIELTLRTERAVECLREVRKAAPGMLLCAGTVLTPRQVEEVVEVGVDFAVAPGCNPRVLEAAAQAGLCFGPGIATATEVEIALENGCRVLKYFPAETSGGLKHLQTMASPFLHLSPRFIPLGGLTLGNFATYLDDPLIAAVGGSWIAPCDLVEKQDWESIRSNARAVMERLSLARH